MKQPWSDVFSPWIKHEFRCKCVTSLIAKKISDYGMSRAILVDGFFLLHFFLEK